MTWVSGAQGLPWNHPQNQIKIKEKMPKRWRIGLQILTLLKCLCACVVQPRWSLKTFACCIFLWRGKLWTGVSSAWKCGKARLSLLKAASTVLGTIYFEYGVSASPQSTLPVMQEAERGLVLPEPPVQRGAGLPWLLWRPRARKAWAQPRLSLQCLSVPMWQTVLFSFLERLNICISLKCKWGLLQMSFFYHFVHSWLFRASFSLMTVTPIHILWIQDITPSLTVASFIYLISVIQHFKLSFWILFVL